MQNKYKYELICKWKWKYMLVRQCWILSPLHFHKEMIEAFPTRDLWGLVKSKKYLRKEKVVQIVSWVGFSSSEPVYFEAYFVKPSHIHVGWGPVSSPVVSQSDEIVFSFTKIPSEMELAPRYTPLFTMLIIFKLFYTAETVAVCQLILFWGKRVLWDSEQKVWLVECILLRCNDY